MAFKSLYSPVLALIWLFAIGHCLAEYSHFPFSLTTDSVGHETSKQELAPSVHLEHHHHYEHHRNSETSTATPHDSAPHHETPQHHSTQHHSTQHHSTPCQMKLFVNLLGIFNPLATVALLLLLVPFALLKLIVIGKLEFVSLFAHPFLDWGGGLALVWPNSVLLPNAPPAAA